MAKSSKRFPKVLQPGLLTAVQRLSAPEIQARWGFWLIGILLLMCLFLSISISFLLPNKEYIPYFITETDTGEVTMSRKVGERFQPSMRNVEYFTRRFVEGVLVVDEQTRYRIPELAHFVKGAAVSQLKDWVSNVDRPLFRLAQDSTYRRSIEFERSIDFIPSDDLSGKAIAWLLVKTYENKRTRTQRISVSMDYAILPLTDAASVINNPIGLYITNFGFERLQ